MIDNSTRSSEVKVFVDIQVNQISLYIDCDDMEVGDTVEFAVVCSDRRQTVKAGTKVTKKLRTGVGNSDKGRITPQPSRSKVFGLCHGSNPHGDLVQVKGLQKNAFGKYSIEPFLRF